MFRTSHIEYYFLEEIISKCCVLFIKDFLRGKPAGFLSKDCFICESRYLEQGKNYQKIKVWNSNLSAGVKNTDVVLELFDELLNIYRSVPSHLYIEAPVVKISPFKKRKSSLEPLEPSKKVSVSLAFSSCVIILFYFFLFHLAIRCTFTANP